MKPQPPEKPTEASSATRLDAWFEYYHEMKARGFRITLKQIAEETEYSYGHVRDLHAAYLARRK